jgi:hypothetical protein
MRRTSRKWKEAAMGTTLLKQNPWLRDPKARAEALRVAAASSSAVEGIRKPFANKKLKGGASRKGAKSGA